MVAPSPAGRLQPACNSSELASPAEAQKRHTKTDDNSAAQEMQSPLTTTPRALDVLLEPTLAVMGTGEEIQSVEGVQWGKAQE